MSGSKERNGSSDRSKKGKDKDSKSQKKESKASSPSNQASGSRARNNKNGQSAASGSSQAKSKHGEDSSGKYPTSRKRFVCNTCGNSYARDEDLREHTADAHGPPRYACDQCRQKFRRHAELEKHKYEMHPPKTIIRPKTDREPPSGERSLLSLGADIKSSSQESSSSIHSTGYQCPICGLSFSRKQTLQNHYLTVHIKRR